MAVILTDEQRHRVEEFRARHKTGVLTLLFTDMVGSTDSKRELGDAAGGALVTLQQQVVRGLLLEFDEAEEIGTAGDSFFITFIRPSDAVRFSLLVQSRLRASSLTTPRPVVLRIGIHMGEVFIDPGEEGARKRDVLGIQVDAASRVMLLAVGGQILMTRSVFDNARAVLRGVDIPGLRSLTWLNHGFFRAQGVEEPFEVCEVGEEDAAPLAPPPNTNKAQRFIIPDLEPVVGWQPALEVEVPTARGWVLTEKIGEGGFGEVWKAYHKGLREDRLFKFCFRADRVRSLRREVTLFRLLREKFGDHPNIIRIHDVYFEDPPYYIVMEYFPAKDLAKWSEARGGPAKIPLETRLMMVIQIAEALQVAHDAGILHRDIKPSNILVGGTGDGPDEIRVKLTDFGIGQVVPEKVSQAFTTSGLTEIFGRTEMSSRTGTRVYMAPEVLAGRPSSVASDIYSLGVVFYQLVIGDLSQPVTTDWREQVADPLLAEDIASCFSGKPGARFATAQLLADHLRALDQRRQRMEEEEEHRRTAAEKALRRARMEEEKSQHTLYCTTISLAAKCIEELRYLEARELLDGCPPEQRGWEWGRLQYLCHLDLATLKGHDGPVSSVAWSADDRMIATGSNDGRVCLWSAHSGEWIGELSGHESRVDAIAFQPGGSWLATATSEGVVRLWDAAARAEIRKLSGHSNLVDSISFSADGLLLASGSWDKTARIWDVQRGKEIALFEGRSPLSVTMNPQGQCLALGCWDNEAHVWDVENRKQIVVLKGRFPTYGIYAAAFSPDGAVVVTGAQDGTAKAWELVTGRELQRIKGHFGGVSAIAVSPRGKEVMTGSSDRTARLWDLASIQEALVIRGHGETVSCAAFSPDGLYAVTGSFDKTAKVWSLENDKECSRLIGHTSNVWSVAFSPDGKSLATGSGETVWGASSEMGVDNTVRVWDVSTGEERQVLRGHTSNVWSVAFSPDGLQLATGSADRTIRVWDTETGHVIRQFDAHEGFVLDLAFSPDGLSLVSGGRDFVAILWDVQKGLERYRLKRHAGPVAAVAFHPSGRWLATGSWDRTARIWDMESGQEIHCLGGHSANIEAVAFSPDGSLLATGGKDNSIRLWDPSSGEQVALWLGTPPASVTSLAFSPDGRRLLSGSGDHSAKVWDVETGKELLRLRAHTWFVVSVAFSADGRLAATGSSDNTAILWPAFPWEERCYQGQEGEPLGERMERFKRIFWRQQMAMRSKRGEGQDVSAGTLAPPLSS
jgi:WD40 repeat protein/class 3 adenylate cyclase/tRNA A-37 threonylcarbamoyl transferase component Bud32